MSTRKRAGRVGGGSARRRTALVSLAATLLVAASLWLLLRPPWGAREPRRPLRAGDFQATPVRPLDELDWPGGRSRQDASLARAVGLVSEAMSLYDAAAAAQPSSARFDPQRQAADRALTAALELLEELGPLPPGLSPYHLRSVELALLARDYTGARQHIERWLTRFSEDYDHLFALGKTEFQLHRWAAAAAALRRAAALRPASLEARHWLAEVCFQMGTSEEGVRAVREGLDLLAFPAADLWDHPTAQTFLGNAIKVLHRFQEYGLLEEVARFYRARQPDSLEATMAEGVAMVHLGRYRAAEPLLRESLRDAANRHEVLFTLGLAQAKQGKWKEAERSFATLLAEDPFFARGYYQLGLCLSRLDRIAPAEVLFARSRQLAASERELRRSLELAGIGAPGRAAATRSRGYSLRGQYDEAEAALRARSLREDPFAVLALAEFYLDVLRVSDADRVLSHAATLIPPEHADIEANRARLLFRRGREDEALDRLALLVAQPAAAHWRLEHGRLLLEAGRFQAAATALAATAAVDSEGEVLHYLGRALLAGGRAAEALTALRRISPGDKRWDGWHGDLWLAWALAAAGEGEASLEKAARLLAAAPASHRTLEVYVRAKSALIARAPRRAEGDEAAALESALARYAATREQVKHLKHRLARTPWREAGPHYLSLARLLADRGERDEAIRFGRLARAASGGHPDALRFLAASLTDDGEAFFRLRALRDLASRVPGDAAVRAELTELEARWLPADRGS